jgi:uncharacterized repeat protein (TIGR01451 family)
MRKFLANERGISMAMVVGFLALSVPVVTGALALAGTLSQDSASKNRLAKVQYSSVGVQNYIEHMASTPAGLQAWVDLGCPGALPINGEVITFACDLPSAEPGDSPSLTNRQFRSFKEVTPSAVAAGVDTLFTYTIRAFNDSGMDSKTHHGHLGHGYWKQPHHFAMWQAPYDPADSFNATFGLTSPHNLSPDQTLLEALREGGGHQASFNRDAVAGLLNAASPAITFAYSEAQVKSSVLAAYAGGDYDHYQSLLRGQNLGSCFDDDVVAGVCDHFGDDDEGEPGGQALQRIYDGLPPGFAYVAGSTRINGQAAGNPTIGIKTDKDYNGPGNLGPTYWRNASNYASWTGYAQDAKFYTVFTVANNANTNKTLIQILNQNSGTDERKMQKEAVAALLNAAHLNIAFLYPQPQDVINLVVAAYNPGAPDFDDVEEDLNDANQDAHFASPGRTMLFWDLEDLNVSVPAGEMLELEFGARATLAQGNYCNEAWVTPGHKDHDNADNNQGRGSGTDMTARVKAGNPVEQLCPGDSVLVTTRVDQEVLVAGVLQQLTYTIEVENVGTTTLHMARINDILPLGFNYLVGHVGGSLTDHEPVVTDHLGSNHLEWSGPFATTAKLELLPGEKETLSFRALADVGLKTYTNDVWIYFAEFTGSESAAYSWPTAAVRAMSVYDVTATDGDGHVTGTCQVWIGTDETIVRC